jgi:signal transduction histidine kinase
VGIAGLLAALALVYSNSSGVIEVTDAAGGQHRAQSALTAIAASRSALAQTMLLAAAEPRLAVAAAAETGDLLAELEARVTALAATADDPALLTGPLDTVLELGHATLAAVVAGDVDTAASRAADTVDAFDDMTAAVVEVRDHHSAVIAEAASRAGSVATASRFMVALVVPLIGVIVAFVFVRRERRRERLSAELEHERNLNKSKDQLIANLSHELRTPLTGIYTSAMAVEDMGESEPELSRELNGLIVDQAADLTRMVEDLLVSAQADAGRLHFDCAPTPLLAQLESVKREIGRMGAEITVRVRDADVVVDPGRLRQVLRNLLSNAVRHGGDAISVEGRPEGGSYRLVIADDGDGVPDEVADRMFQRFVHQGDTPLITGSVGLGLAITKVLTEGMDGTIEHERSDGLTRFVITLPMEVESAGETGPDEGEATDASPATEGDDVAAHPTPDGADQAEDPEDHDEQADDPEDDDADDAEHEQDDADDAEHEQDDADDAEHEQDDADDAEHEQDDDEADQDDDAEDPEGDDEADDAEDPEGDDEADQDDDAEDPEGDDEADEADDAEDPEGDDAEDEQDDAEDDDAEDPEDPEGDDEDPEDDEDDDAEDPEDDDAEDPEDDDAEDPEDDDAEDPEDDDAEAAPEGAGGGEDDIGPEHDEDGSTATNGGGRRGVAEPVSRMSRRRAKRAAARAARERLQLG